MRKKSIIFLVMSLLILTFSSSAFAVEANSEFKSESQKFFTITEYELRLLQTGQPRKIGDLFLIKKDFTPVLPNF